MQVSERKLNRLFDEWSRLCDLALEAKKDGRLDERDKLIEQREAAWKRYIAAARADEHYEQEAKHDEKRNGMWESDDGSD